MLKKLHIKISGKSIIVIEDIDCALDLTGQRKKKQNKEGKDLVEKAVAETGADQSKLSWRLLSIIWTGSVMEYLEESKY